MTLHRCTDGTWKPDQTRYCPKCKAKRKPRTVKQTGES